MAELKPTYDFYRAWGGALEEDTFQAAIPTAYARVKQRCCAFALSELTEDEQEVFKGAVCAACEALSDDKAGISSYSAGKVSVTFSDTQAAGNTVDAAIERELSGSKLICAVI